MEKHFTAWITTIPDALQGDFCDVVVLRDEIVGYREDYSGNEIPEWSSDGTGPVFEAVLSVRHNEDANDRLIDEAETALEAAGWTIHRENRWEPVTTGCIATVSRA